MSVCLLAYLKKRTSNLDEIFCPYGRGLVFLWRQFNMMCTSGFVDDVMFPDNRAYVVHSKAYTTDGYQSAGGNAERGGVSALHICLSLRCLPISRPPRHTQRSLTVDANNALHTGAKSATIDRLVYFALYNTSVVIIIILCSGLLIGKTWLCIVNRFVRSHCLMSLFGMDYYTCKFLYYR